MGSLQFHQQQQILILMTPISVPCNLRSLCCIRSFFSTTCSPKLLFCTTSKIKALNRVSAAAAAADADELKEQWLNSLNCPPPIVKQKDPNNNDDEEEVGLNNVESQSQSESQWVIGIDPDVSGALALLKPYHLPSSAQVYDSPNVKVLIGNRVRRRMDTKAMVDLLRSLSIPTGTTAYIEQSLPYPGDGKQGWWSGGFNYGLWIGVLVASGVSVVPVPSMRWKQEFKLSGNGKTKGTCMLPISNTKFITEKEKGSRYMHARLPYDISYAGKNGWVGQHV
ncbi:hypothetical protein M8C21_013793 [Ambrosia artemisiifolia]|uniref:Uncharacterized protein n=1 Tax=Ambrosia artemisiifolia TaxID=4212 RepID=A0AAD5GWH0_AMBAR|nr:hypothetical protein M8C21_013793 [Ambrosia artemisiifolia]